MDGIGKVFMCRLCQICKFTRESLIQHQLKAHPRGDLEAPSPSPSPKPATPATRVGEATHKPKKNSAGARKAPQKRVAVKPRLNLPPKPTSTLKGRPVTIGRPKVVKRTRKRKDELVRTPSASSESPEREDQPSTPDLRKLKRAKKKQPTGGRTKSRSAKTHANHDAAESGDDRDQEEVEKAGRKQKGSEKSKIKIELPEVPSEEEEESEDLGASQFGGNHSVVENSSVGALLFSSQLARHRNGVQLSSDQTDLRLGKEKLKQRKRPTVGANGLTPSKRRKTKGISNAPSDPAQDCQGSAEMAQNQNEGSELLPGTRGSSSRRPVKSGGKRKARNEAHRLKKIQKNKEKLGLSISSDTTEVITSSQIGLLVTGESSHKETRIGSKSPETPSSQKQLKAIERSVILPSDSGIGSEIIETPKSAKSHDLGENMEPTDPRPITSTPGDKPRKKKAKKKFNDAETSTSQDLALKTPKSHSPQDGSNSSGTSPGSRPLVSVEYMSSTNDTESEDDGDGDGDRDPNNLDRLLEMNPPLNLVDIKLALTALHLTRECFVSVGRMLCNEIVVSPGEAEGEVVVLYTGLDSERKKYVEWRKETIQRFGRVNARTKRKLALASELKLLIPRALNHVFSVSGPCLWRDDLHSILDTLTGQKMSTALLDAYLSQKVLSYNAKVNAGVKADYKLRPHSETTFEYLSLNFLPVLTKDWDMDSLKPLLKFFPRGDFRQSVLIAPLYSCEHFYLAVLDFPKRQIYIFDSAWHFFPIDFRFHHVRILLKILVRNFVLQGTEGMEGWDIFIQSKCAQQLDEVSCGAFVIYYVENFLKDKLKKSEDKLGPLEVQRIRRDIVRTLLPTTRVGEELLEAITF